MVAGEGCGRCGLALRWPSVRLVRRFLYFFPWKPNLLYLPPPLGALWPRLPAHSNLVNGKPNGSSDPPTGSLRNPCCAALWVVAQRSDKYFNFLHEPYTNGDKVVALGD